MKRQNFFFHEIRNDNFTYYGIYEYFRKFKSKFPSTSFVSFDLSISYLSYSISCEISFV